VKEEHVSISLEQLTAQIKNAFSSGNDSALQGRSREDWLGLRLDLPLLCAKEVQRLLPSVMIDVAQTGEFWGNTYDDMVILFLDVLGIAFDRDTPEGREIIRRFADGGIGGAAGEELKAMMALNPWAREGKSECEQRSEERKAKLSSFSEITIDQSKAIYHFLEYLRELPSVSEGAIRHDAERASLYWRLRSGIE
jgi:hypothetical protein